MIPHPLAPSVAARLLFIAALRVRMRTLGGPGSGPQKSTTVYHGTTKDAAEKILKEGLRPDIAAGADAALTGSDSFSRTMTVDIGTTPGHVYVSTDKAMAESYAKMVAKAQGKEAAVLQIQVPKEHAHKLNKAEGEIDRRFKGAIPSKWIRALGTVSSPIHRVADRYLTPMMTVVAYAFKKGRAAVDTTALKSATTERDALSAMDAAPTAIADTLRSLLPRVLRKIVVDAGVAGAKQLKLKVRTAGGPGSGPRGSRGGTPHEKVDRLPKSDLSGVPKEDVAASDVFDKSVVEESSIGPTGDIRKQVEGEVVISNLIPTQNTLYRKLIHDKIDKKDESKTPLVYQDGSGRQYIADGHHQLAAEKMKGERTAKVTIVHFYKEFPKPRRLTAAEAVHAFSTTQVDLPPGATKRILRMAANIPDADLAVDGRVDDPHITVKYGLHATTPDDLRPLLLAEKPVRAMLESTSLFEHDEYDVVKIDVFSPDLVRLNELITRTQPNTTTQDGYFPHITLAYVKRGLGWKYAGDETMKGWQVEFNWITFSSQDHTKSYLRLGGGWPRTLGGPGSGPRKGSGKKERSKKLPSGPVEVRGYFDMKSIQDRHFLYDPETNRLLLGSELNPEHPVEETHASVAESLGVNGPEFDKFTVRGYLRSDTVKVTTVPREHVEQSDALHALYDKVLANGATHRTGVDIGWGPRPLGETMKHLAKNPLVNFAFDVSSPEAIAWAEEHAGELIDGITKTTRESIADAIASALDGDGIGAAYDDILDAIGDEARAEMIARTETMDAANEGLVQSWSQATEAGLLTGKEKKVWIGTADECDDCAEMDGEEVPMDDDFSSGDDPPLHPNCRCTIGLAIKAVELGDE